MSVHIFTYGTLINRQIWKSVVGNEYKNKKATLEGYRCGIIKNEVYPGIVKNPNKNVEGIIYFDLSFEDLQKLDNYETNFYFKEKANVFCDGENIECLVYVVKKEFEHMVLNEWEYEYFVENHLMKFIENFC